MCCPIRSVTLPFVQYPVELKRMTVVGMKPNMKHKATNSEGVEHSIAVCRSRCYDLIDLYDLHPIPD